MSKIKLWENTLFEKIIAVYDDGTEEEIGYIDEDRNRIYYADMPTAHPPRKFRSDWNQRQYDAYQKRNNEAKSRNGRSPDFATLLQQQNQKILGGTGIQMHQHTQRVLGGAGKLLTRLQPNNNPVKNTTNLMAFLSDTNPKSRTPKVLQTKVLQTNVLKSVINFQELIENQLELIKQLDIITTYQHGARYYIPWLARWLSCDPINSENYNLEKGYGLEKNKERHFLELCASSYEYAYDSPIRFSDPTGEQPTFTGSVSSYNVDKTGTLKVHLHISINVAVINKSNTKIDNTEGQTIASELQRRAVQISFDERKTGVLTPNGQTTHLLSMVQGKDKVKRIEYTLTLEQKFRYVNNVNQINQNDQILVLVDEHSSESNQYRKQDVGGKANYDIGTATVDIMDVIGGVYIKSVGKHTTKNSNSSNHEVGHLLGLEDRYNYDANGKLIHNESNLMGAGNYFNLIGNQFDEIMYNAMAEVGVTWMMKQNNVPESRMKNKMSDYGHGGLRIESNYKQSPQERTDLSIKRNNAIVK